jgi:outer membrane protein assembly factor BamD (BamD/ComL family)
VAAADDVDKRFTQVRQLLLLERYDQALQLLERVEPSSEIQLRTREHLLALIYSGQKNYAALELLAVQALEREPGRDDRAHWLFMRAELYLKADLIDSGHVLLESLWRADPTDSTIARVTHLYEQHSLSDWSQATYEAARLTLGDSTRFAFELAVLYESRRDYARSTAEYFNAIARDTAQTRAVENRIIKLIQTDEGQSPMELELQKAAGTPEGALPARKLLVTLYLETGRPDAAWRAARDMDSLTGQGGVTLITFMRQATDRGYYNEAQKAAWRILTAYPSSPIRHQAEWELAQLAVRTGDYRDAEARLLRLARESPAMRFRIESALAYGDIRAREFHDLETADSVFVSVTARQRNGRYYDRAMLGRTFVATARGDLEGARGHLLELSRHDPQGTAREELTYRLAELAYFAGDLDGAQETWNGLINDFPKSIWVNDALRYVLVLTAYAQVAPADLKALGRAEALARRRQYDSALTLLGGLRTTSEAPLAPLATLVAARLHRDAGRGDSALALWDWFIEAYPDDPDAPFALMQAAQLCDTQMDDQQAALSRYRALLEAYPRSHWSEEARRRLRTLGQL